MNIIARIRMRLRWRKDIGAQLHAIVKQQVQITEDSISQDVTIGGLRRRIEALEGTPGYLAPEWKKQQAATLQAIDQLSAQIVALRTDIRAKKKRARRK